jgi:dihydrodipicolinate synthase/N-acetylneuraminate lyase
MRPNRRTLDARLRAVHPRLRGAIAAAVTPLRDHGASIDDDAIASLVAFLVESGIDGVLACGTTGEGILLRVDERRRVTELVLDARPAGFQVAVHAGAQTTADTVALATHAASAGANAVAVIGPPYFPLDDGELFRHFASAASACDPLPFYVYEFRERAGYAIPLDVIARLRDAVPNVAGLKVSDTPFEAARPYLIDGLDVFMGQEPLALEGMEHGAVGCVSGLATAFPDVVAALVHDKDATAHDRVVALREGLAKIPFLAAMKQVLVDRGVLTSGDVRAPLRGLTEDERARVRALIGTSA